MAPRAKPYFLRSPIDPQKIEQIDEMFRIIFDDLRNGNLTIGPGQIIPDPDDPDGGSILFDEISPLTTLGDLLTHNGLTNIRLAVGLENQVLTVIAGIPAWADASAGSGDVVGPALSTDNAIVRFDGITGKLIQNSGITVADSATGTLSGTNSGDVTLDGTPDYITIVDQVITRHLIDLTTDVEGTLPPSGGGFVEHDLLSVEHPDTIEAAPVFGDLIIAGTPVEPVAFVVYGPLTSLLTEDFYGIRPAYVGGIPGGGTPPVSGPYPQYFGSTLEFVAVEVVAGPYPFSTFFQTLLEDDFYGIRPSYVQGPVGDSVIPLVGPYPVYDTPDIEQSAPDSPIVAPVTGQWQRYPIGTAGSVLTVVLGSPQWSENINLPGSIAAVGNIESAASLIGAALDISGNAEVGGTLDISGNATIGGDLAVTDDITADGLGLTGGITALSAIITDDVSIGDDLNVTDVTFSGNGSFEFGRATKLGEWFEIPFDAADFTANVGAWTVASGDLISFRMRLTGPNSGDVVVVIENSSLDSAATLLTVRLPANVVLIGRNVNGVPAQEDTGGGLTPLNDVYAQTRDATRFIDIQRQAGAAFGITTNETDLGFFLPLRLTWTP